MDRLAVAMFHTHGTDLAEWPVSVREMLGMATHATATAEEKTPKARARFSCGKESRIRE